MADYTPLISRAVAALPDNTGEARRAVYERARHALLAQLRGVNPPLQEEQITRERLSLEEAIRKVEAQNAEADLDSMFQREMGDLVQPGNGRRNESISVGGARTVSAAAHDAETLGEAAQSASRSARGQLGGPGEAGDRIEPGLGGAGRPGPYGSDAGPIRPRVSVLDEPEDEQVPRRGRGGKIAVLVVLLLLGAAGGLGWFVATYYPERLPSQLAIHLPGGGQPASQPSPPADEPPKTGDRVAEATPPAPAPADPTPAAPPAVDATPAPAPTPPAADAQPTTPPSDTAPPPAAQATEPPPAAPATPAPAPAPGTVQRAALFEETPGNQAGTLMQGTVVWRTQTVSVGPGQPPDLALVGDVAIPERRMTVTLTIRRNLDQTLPASHTVEVLFALPPNFQFGGVAEVPGLLMKVSEQARGVPLVGQAVRVTNGFFFIGLSGFDMDRSTNIQALKTRPFFDIPIRYDSGRRAILTIEKGAAGDRAFEEAMTAWGQ
ncbi:hypothetical protein [Phreatobacter sp.]|uniref:hypothetical protein n=1 Tax=Phreatobacter sp. TaxID=1966341 RepID=UPI003F6F773C